MGKSYWDLRRIKENATFGDVLEVVQEVTKEMFKNGPREEGMEGSLNETPENGVLL